jgi:tetratricopeptide (TPR) repeat protein
MNKSIIRDRILPGKRAAGAAAVLLLFFLGGAVFKWEQNRTPDNALLLEDLALLYGKQQRNKDAIDYFQRAIQLQPNYMHAHLSFGKFYQDLGRLADAEKEYRTAMRLSPLSIQARNDLGELLFNEGPMGLRPSRVT